MFDSSSDRFFARRVLVPVGAGLIALLSLVRAPAQAEPRTYTITGGEGYGIVDCFSAGVACGRIVADSWCEAHQGGAATAFGLASDVTGSTPGAPAVKRLAGEAVVVTCAE